MFQIIRRHREHIADIAWQALPSLRVYRCTEPLITDNAVMEYRMSLPEKESNTDENHDDAQVEFEDSIIDAMHRLYQLSVSPKRSFKVHMDRCFFRIRH